jgi:outer membrane protein assembly factor BamB
MRLTMDGTVIWSNTTGGAGHEIARAVVSLGSGTFVAAGYTNSYGSFDPETQQIRDHIYLIAFNLNGDTLWTRAIGDTQHHRQAHALAVAPDGDLVFAGEQSTSASSDVFLHRSTSNGNTIWQRTLDTGKEERILHILPLPDAFVCTGWSFGPYGRQVLFIRRNGEGY